MKNFFNIILSHIKHFIVNPFWRSLYTNIIMVVSLLLNGLIWYIYLKQFRGILGITPIAYSSGVLALNIFLSNITYRKEALISFVLLGISLIIQIFIIIFMKYTVKVF